MLLCIMALARSVIALGSLGAIAEFALLATLAGVHWGANTSARGLRESAGIMVNYLYVPPHVEARHSAYVSRGEISASEEVWSLTDSDRKMLREEMGRSEQRAEKLIDDSTWKRRWETWEQEQAMDPQELENLKERRRSEEIDLIDEAMAEMDHEVDVAKRERAARHRRRPRRGPRWRRPPGASRCSVFASSLLRRRRARRGQ